MTSILLAIIYLSFISLGLPDALLGSAWPSMHLQLQAPISYAGIVSMLIAGCTIISSLLCNRMLKKLGIGKLTTLSVCMTAIALFGFSTANSFWMLCVWAIPYGLGAGSVDAALNNFVALHYKARHMSWLHCFWGVGASLGPSIMGYCLTRNLGWNSGYRFVFFIQVVLTVILVFSLPLWKKQNAALEEEQRAARLPTMRELLETPGVTSALLTFFCYCGIEATTGLWSSSYLVEVHGIPVDVAAKWTALFYLGITLGRFLCGFVTLKVSDRNMVRLGQGIIVLGVATLLLPLGNLVLCMGLLLIGIGCAPVFPSLLHATPAHFGKELSQSIMGLQMASAYMGSTLMPPLMGILGERVSMRAYPLCLLLLACLMFAAAENLNKKHMKQ